MCNLHPRALRRDTRLASIRPSPQRVGVTACKHTPNRRSIIRDGRLGGARGLWPTPGDANAAASITNRAPSGAQCSSVRRRRFCVGVRMSSAVAKSALEHDASDLAPPASPPRGRGPPFRAGDKPGLVAAGGIRRFAMAALCQSVWDTSATAPPPCSRLSTCSTALSSANACPCEPHHPSSVSLAPVLCRADGENP
jgi:hypothetical protein